MKNADLGETKTSSVRFIEIKIFVKAKQHKSELPIDRLFKHSCKASAWITATKIFPAHRHIQTVLHSF